MSREPDLTAVNRALSVTVQKQAAELIQADARIRELAGLLQPLACGCRETDYCLPNCPRFAAAQALKGVDRG